MDLKNTSTKRTTKMRNECTEFELHKLLPQVKEAVAGIADSHCMRRHKIRQTTSSKRAQLQ